MFSTYKQGMFRSRSVREGAVPMPRGDCEGVGSTTRQPCCRRRGGSGGALVEPAALAALLSAGGYGYDLRRTIMERHRWRSGCRRGRPVPVAAAARGRGAVVSRWCDDETGPRRREYQVTEQGIELAEQWLDALRQRQHLDELLVGLLEGGLHDMVARAEAAGHPTA